ncbi:MAG: hypothetical protein U0166_02085 [Acidobacteriota bacterium]
MDDRRSLFATFVALLLFGTVAVGSGCVLSLLMSIGPGAEQVWAQAGTQLSLASRLALAASRLLVQSYVPALAIAGALHLFLLVFDLWAGRTPARLLWAATLTCFIVTAELMVLLWLAIAFVLPLLAP